MPQPVRLDRLQRDVAIAQDGKPSQQFQTQWQFTMEKVEAAFLNLQEQIDLIALAQAAADAANAAAVLANAAAVTAQTAATDAADQSSFSTSGVSGLTITATDAGTDVTITISAHTRIYGDGTSVAVTGGSITGLAYSTSYYIYYDDAARAGGAVTYQSTTTAATAAQLGDRHSVGAVTTPAALGAPVGGKKNLGPGLVEP